MSKGKALPAKANGPSQNMVQRTDNFLADPPEIIDYTSFRVFMCRVAECVLRAEVDKNFKFSTKAANTLVYAGATILMALDKERAAGGGGGMMERYQSLAAQVQNMTITAEQAAMLLKAQELSMQINVLERIVSEHKQNVSDAEIVEIAGDTPTLRSIAKLDRAAKQHEDEDEYAF